MLLEVLLKSSVVLGAAGFTMSALRRQPAAARHSLGIAAMGSLPVLAAMQFAVPFWSAGGTTVVLRTVAQAQAVVAPMRPIFPWIGTIWMAGAAILLLRLVLAWLRCMKLARSGRVVGQTDGITTIEADVPSPMLWGVLRPVVFLPLQAAYWPKERLATVLRHELGHAARGDGLWEMINRVVCAVFWFQPLVWWMSRKVTLACEQACDDAVLAEGVKPSEYAGLLVDLARGMRHWSPVGVAMLRRSTLENRLEAILGEANRSPVTRRMVAASMAAMAVLLLPLAGAQEQGPYKIGGDVKAPRLLGKVEPQYTQEARDAKIEGTVKLSVVVTKEGKADRIRVIAGLDPGLDANAVDAIEKWTFDPGTKGGKPVDVIATIEVNFRLR